MVVCTVTFINGQFHIRKLKVLFLKVSQGLETTLNYESTIFKGFCKTNETFS